MEYIVIPDTAIFAVNRGKRENEASSIVYRDGEGKLHAIDFETCAVNFRAEQENAPENCIGQRHTRDLSFVLYTSGIRTKIVFEEMYVGNILRHHLLSGSKQFRFLALWNMVNETRYRVCDVP